jgi:hypothetical protein
MTDLKQNCETHKNITGDHGQLSWKEKEILDAMMEELSP